MPGKTSYQASILVLPKWTGVFEVYALWFVFFRQSDQVL